MPEDTKSLKTGVLTAAEFLEQARIAGDENARQYRYVLSGSTTGCSSTTSATSTRCRT